MVLQLVGRLSVGKNGQTVCGDGQTKARLHPTSEREFGEALILCGSNRSTNAGAACRAFARIVKLLPSPLPLAIWRLLAKGFWGRGFTK